MHRVKLQLDVIPHRPLSNHYDCNLERWCLTVITVQFVCGVLYLLFLFQALGFRKFSLLGWSDGGITALIAAARNPDLINKMVVWGSNAFVSQHDLGLYDGTTMGTFVVNCPWYNLCYLCFATAFWVHVFFCCCWTTPAVRDVSKWSARMRQPMEEVYGAEVFAKTWEAWVDGIAQFAKRPEGSEFLLLQTNSTSLTEQTKTEIEISLQFSQYWTKSSHNLDKLYII